MSAKDNPKFEDLDPVEPSPDSSGSDWINPDTGEEIVGSITAFNPRRGDAGVVEIDGRPYSLNHTQRRELIEALVLGRTMGLHKVADREEKFTNSEGEEVVYNPTEVRFGD